MRRQYDTFIGCDDAYPEAEAVLFGAPFDSTASFRPGARFAPGAIRRDSYGLETYSPYLDACLGDRRICDCGDLELPLGSAERALVLIERHASQILRDQKVPVMLGGEHLVTLGAVRAAAFLHNDLHVLHFDAHADLRDEYLGETLSHATVMHRVWELLGDGRIGQFGIRSGEREEFLFAEAHTHMGRFTLDTLGPWLKQLQDKPVYLTIDLDVLDPSVFPGTGTPEPGGVGFAQLHDAVLTLRGLNIIGCDIVELSPHYDRSGVSTAVACKLLREILLLIRGGR